MTSVELATPGSYGEQPTGFRLPAMTALGAVSLQVSSLDRSLAYYEGVLGFRTIDRDGSVASLAAHGDDRTLITLYERAGARQMTARGRLGLYHFAILLPDRPALASFAQHLARSGVRAGSADHLVSEAFYLQDPDGLGIEVYADRPRTAWQRVGRELVMTTIPIDGKSLLGSVAQAWNGMPAGTMIGHVHLHVGDIADASAFYSDLLGFDRVVWQYPGALFLSASEYHHHVGVNTWAGTGAVPPSEHDARLREWTLELPDAASMRMLTGSLTAAGAPMVHDDADIITHDPWGTAVRIRVRGEQRRESTSIETSFGRGAS